jgi:hypothetical protein
MKIIFYLSLVFILAMALAALFIYFNDRRIFGKQIAKKNTYHTIGWMPIFWIYLVVSCQILLFFLDFKKSDLMNYVIGLMLTAIPVFFYVTMSRILSGLYAMKRLGNRITNSRMGSMPRSYKFYQLFTIGIFIYVALQTYFDFPANSRVDLLLIYAALSGFFIFVLALPLVDEIEFREQGIYGGYFAIKWNQIEAYKLENEDNTLHLQHKSIWPIRRHLEFQIPRNSREEIMALLDLYLSDQNSE